MSGLLSRLPEVRGTYQTAAKLAQHTWFGVGGPADILFCPLDENDLATFLAGCPSDIPVTVMGAGSNQLVRDGGVSGVVIKMNAHFTGIHHDGTQIIAMTEVLMPMLLAMPKRLVFGLEFLIGIPGTIGGGLRMNAGAYGKEFRDVTRMQQALTGKAIQFRQHQPKWAWRTGTAMLPPTGFLQPPYYRAKPMTPRRLNHG